MKISKFLVAALLLTSIGAAAAPAVLAVPATPAAPAAPAIKLSGITGVVLIKTAGGTMTVKAGEPIPEIPSGAEIVVQSGEANVAVGGTTIKAGAGDSFTVNTSGSGASIKVTGGVVAVVDSTGASKDLVNGEGLTVSVAGTPASATPVVKTAKKKTETPESIPADAGDADSSTTGSNLPTTSVTQEAANTTSTVSPSAP